jgi:hypothetical protein
MASKLAKPHPRIGRPPAGAQAGEKVKDYPQLSIRLPDDVKAKLHALSLVGSRPQWRIVTDAIECYLRERPAGERQMGGRSRRTVALAIASGGAHRQLDRRGRRLTCRSDWKVDQEGRATAALRRHRDVAAVLLHDAVHD